MLAFALALALAQAPLTSDVEDARLEPRFRWGVQAIGVYTVGPAKFGAGAGLQFEAGVVLQDTISITARIFAATVLFSGDGGGTLGVDFALGRYFTLGTGLSGHAYFFLPAGLAASVGVPFRLTFNPNQRACEGRRSSWASS